MILCLGSMVMRTLHWLIVLLYIAAPIGATLHAIVRTYRGRMLPAARLLVTIGVASVVGTTLCMAYSTALRSRTSLAQLLLTIYISTAVLLVLKGFDWGLKRLLGLHRLEPTPDGAVPRLVPARALLRGVLLIGIGLPYVLSTLLVYRPKVSPSETPEGRFGFNYREVEFESMDGVRLAGWWIPAADASGRWRSARAASFGSQTVLVCPGTGAGKSEAVMLARKLVPAGFNALVFDFRAQGESRGQFSSFGDLERQDVLGAVRWLREQHRGQCKRIVGVGQGTGAAALIAAAADSSDEGQSIAALAIYGGFDDLDLLARDRARETFLSPMDSLLHGMTVPLASVQVGVNLGRFRPAELIARIWPRPVLVVHGTEDELIPFDRGEQLFNAASYPKLQYWIAGAGHRQALEDETAASVVRYFFETARARQII